MGPRVGYLLPLNQSYLLDINLDYHNVFADPENQRYLGINVGLVAR